MKELKKQRKWINIRERAGKEYGHECNEKRRIYSAWPVGKSGLAGWELYS